MVRTIAMNDAEDCNDCSVGFREKTADFCVKDGHEKAPNRVLIWSATSSSYSYYLIRR